MAFARRYPGGAELEISTLFVDVRGSSRMAEGMTAASFSALMNRFFDKRIAFVGTVSGAEDTVNDITALGDNVNVTARLASMAAPGEALISEIAYAAGGVDLGELDQRQLELRGRSESISARVLRVSAA